MTAPAFTDAQRLARMVVGLAEVFNVTLTEGRTRGYVEALKDVPLDLLQRGFKRAVVTWRYPDMPKPADLRAYVDSERDDEQRLLSAPVGDGPRYVCTNCDDSGWVIVEGRTDRKQPTARRCACYQTNSRLVQPKRFSEDERR
jgi:hypothetical protein